MRMTCNPRNPSGTRVLGGEGKSGAILLLGLAALGLVFGPGNQAPYANRRIDAHPRFTSFSSPYPLYGSINKDKSGRY